MTAQNINIKFIPEKGNTIGAANFLVVQTGFSVPVILYSDASLTSTIQNPVTVDSSGNVNFWVADGSVSYSGYLSGGYVKQ